LVASWSLGLIIFTTTTTTTVKSASSSSSSSSSSASSSSAASTYLNLPKSAQHQQHICIWFENVKLSPVPLGKKLAPPLTTIIRFKKLEMISKPDVQYFMPPPSKCQSVVYISVHRKLELWHSNPTIWRVHIVRYTMLRSCKLGKHMTSRPTCQDIVLTNNTHGGITERQHNASDHITWGGSIKTVGTCESAVCIWIESRIESAVGREFYSVYLINLCSTAWVVSRYENCVLCL